MKKPELVKRTTKKKDGEIWESKEWYFRVYKNGKSHFVNTGTANKQKATVFMREYLERFSFISTDEAKSPKFAIPEDAFKKTIVDVLKEQGWLVPATNPKYLRAKNQNENYGMTQAQKLAYSFNHMFIDIGSVDDFADFLRKNQVIKTNKIEYYTDFVRKPFLELTKRDASNFINFINEYCDWLKKEKKGKTFKFFINNAKINIISLKCFFSYNYKMGVVENNIFALEKIPKQQVVENKEVFTLQQLQIMFNDNFIKEISKDFIIKNFINSGFYRAYKFAALTGMRSAEIRALQWKQIDASKHIVEINQAFKVDSTKKMLWDYQNGIR